MTINLHDYITNQMKMSHIYQPVMLKVLLENNGEASIEQIASALLSYDQSQVEHYGIRTQRMVGKVLTNNGVVEPVKSGRRTTGFKLNSEAISKAQRASLVARCDDNIRSLNKRGDALWKHRASDSGYISGSTRYNVLKRAKYRCELCGAHESQIALHVDHIIPGSKVVLMISVTSKHCVRPAMPTNEQKMILTLEAS